MTIPHVRRRDWIAVDQLLRRLLDNAPTERDRAVLRHAAEASGGPDPDVPGGGQHWQDAIAVANLQILKVTATMPPPPALATMSASDRDAFGQWLFQCAAQAGVDGLTGTEALEATALRIAEGSNEASTDSNQSTA